MATPTGAENRNTKRLRRDVVMVGLALVSIGILGIEEFATLDETTHAQVMVLDLGIVAIFWIEYLMRLRRHEDKRAFLIANWYDLPGMIPIFPGMESLSGARFLRLLRVLRILRLVGALRRFEKFDRMVARFTRRSKLGYVALLAFVLITGCAAIVWSVEPDTFPTFEDALWWGVVTATTVGYGDFYPRTGLGRGAGVVLMFLGVGLIGTFAATLSSFLVERRFEERAQDAGQEGPAPALPIGFGIATELERLDRLRESGALTPEEFAAAKRRVLGP